MTICGPYFVYVKTKSIAKFGIFDAHIYIYSYFGSKIQIWNLPFSYIFLSSLDWFCETNNERGMKILNSRQCDDELPAVSASGGHYT